MLRAALAGGVQRRVDFGCAQGFKQRDGERGLQQRFPAGNRHAPAGFLVKDPVLGQLCNNLLHGHGAADHLAGAGGTRFDAGTALGALVVSRRQGAVARHAFPQGTCRAAFATGHATAFNDDDFAPGRDALGVMTPRAAQGAALEKDRGTDARPVVHRVFLNIEDEAGLHGRWSFSTVGISPRPVGGGNRRRMGGAGIVIPF